MIELTPITLTGETVQLVPLSEAHVPDLAAVGLGRQIWDMLVYNPVESEADMLGWVREVLRRQGAGTDLPFTVIERASGRAIGCTRYLDIRIPHRGLEIGGTWYGPAFQGTRVNPECKYLLLRQAFEVFDCLRVQLKTDLRNLRSQHAIEKLGAVREGVLRDALILPDGYVRSSVYYSILKAEWPAVKARLEQRLAA